jgi:hypothetical protein
MVILGLLLGLFGVKGIRHKEQIGEKIPNSR